MGRILVTGANGQIGSDLVKALQMEVGRHEVVSSDLRPPPQWDDNGSIHHVILDVLDKEDLDRVVEENDIDTIYHLASLLSVSGEKNLDLAWDVNLNGLKNVLDVARQHDSRVFWPSSIAVFGPDTPRNLAPQTTVLDPRTVYGITKVSGELLCRYYHDKFGLDVRSLRYPGIIGFNAPPGGGTTDYAVEIFLAAAAGDSYTCFVGPETRLPMMYMPDAVKAAWELMSADSSRITVRTSYNVSAVSFSVEEVAEEIRRHIPGFQVSYVPDQRQAIADTWPEDIDDSIARRDWGWRHEHDLPDLVEDMLAHVKPAAVAESGGDR
jgi:nucleoside-diphosphate-sugar epimerase